jgi:long-chain fatty acid transport protein
MKPISSKKLKRLSFLISITTSTLISSSAWAVNDATAGGYGTENAAMGGASIALSLDSIAAANNPAGMAYVGDVWDLNLQTIFGKSSSNYVLPGNQLNNSTTILALGFGFNYHLNDKVTVGLSTSNGGSTADYKQASLNIAYQNYESTGTIVPAPVPGGLFELPDHGKQTATGTGFRLGVLWQINPELSVGANYNSRTTMGPLNGYRNDVLQYSDGHIDIPELYGVRLSWRPTTDLTIAVD